MADVIKTRYMDKATRGYSEYVARDLSALQTISPKEGDRGILSDGSLYICLDNGKWDIIGDAKGTIVKDLEEISDGTVDKWEYNKFYKSVTPNTTRVYDYIFDDGTTQIMGELLPISIIVKSKEQILDSTHGSYEKDIVYNFDGNKTREWIIDPKYKTIVLREFVPTIEINETATNNQYPTALAVKNYVDTIIGGIENGSY